MTPSCLVAVSIDVECDKDEHWGVRRPLGFRGVEEGIGSRLTPLFAQYGVRPTYLLSPEVIRESGCVSLLAAIGDCELGAHLHPEFVRSSEGVKETSAVACLMPEEIERRDIEELTRSFAEAFGRRPVSYRAGRYGASARSLRILAGLGYQVDTSVTPHKRWDDGLDFSGAPGFPYYPQPDDITRLGPPDGILEVPVSLRPSPAPGFLRTPAQLLARSGLSFTKDFAKWTRGPAWFRPGWSKRSTLLAFVRAAARGENGRVLNMMFHNVDIVAGCSPNSGSEATVRTALDDLRAVFEEILALGGSFATLIEIRGSFAQNG
jgi:hypothetical protein